MKNLIDLIKNCDDEYTLTNINGFLNIAIDEPELFNLLIKAVQSNDENKYDLSGECAEKIEDLGL